MTASALVLYDPETRRYRVHVLSFAKNESFIEEGVLDSDCKTPARMAMTSRRPAVLGEQDLKDLAEESKCAEYWVAEGMRSFLPAPLLLHDRVLGALDIGRRREDTFSPEEVEMLGRSPNRSPSRWRTRRPIGKSVN